METESFTPTGYRPLFVVLGIALAVQVWKLISPPAGYGTFDGRDLLIVAAIAVFLFVRLVAADTGSLTPAQRREVAREYAGEHFIYLGTNGLVEVCSKSAIEDGSISARGLKMSPQCYVVN